MGERLVLNIPLIEPGNLQAECIGIVPLPGGTDASFFPRKLDLSFKTDREGRPNAIRLSGPTVTEPVIEFRIQTSCGTSVARDYTLLAMPAPELRYAPAVVGVVQPPVVARTAPASGESVRPARSARPGPSLEQMAGSRYPDQRSKREAFKQQVRALNADVLQGVGDHASIPLDVNLEFPAEEPQQAAPAPAKKKQAAKKTDSMRKAAKKPAKSKPAPKPTPPPAVARKRRKPRSSLSLHLGLSSQLRIACKSAVVAVPTASCRNRVRSKRAWRTRQRTRSPSKPSSPPASNSRSAPTTT